MSKLKYNSLEIGFATLNFNSLKTEFVGSEFEKVIFQVVIIIFF